MEYIMCDHWSLKKWINTVSRRNKQQFKIKITLEKNAKTLETDIDNYYTK